MGVYLTRERLQKLLRRAGVVISDTSRLHRPCVRAGATANLSLCPRIHDLADKRLYIRGGAEVVPDTRRPDR